MKDITISINDVTQKGQLITNGPFTANEVVGVLFRSAVAVSNWAREKAPPLIDVREIEKLQPGSARDQVPSATQRARTTQIVGRRVQRPTIRRQKPSARKNVK